MKYSKKRLELFGRLALVGAVFFVLFIVGYYTGFLRQNCKDDVSCFEQRARACRPSDLVFVQDNNVYLYSVGSSIWDCTLHVTLKRVEEGAPQEFKQLEGKKMTCVVPKKELDAFSFAQFDSYLHYCHGLLKEGLYEIILQRVYSNLVGQMGGILQQAEEALKK